MIESTVFKIKCKNPDTETIESEFKRRFGEIVRWAITDSSYENLKISVTYEKETD